MHRSCRLYLQSLAESCVISYWNETSFWDCLLLNRSSRQLRWKSQCLLCLFHCQSLPATSQLKHKIIAVLRYYNNVLNVYATQNTSAEKRRQRRYHLYHRHDFTACIFLDNGQLSTHVVVSYLLMSLLVIYSCHCQLSTHVIGSYLLMSLLVIYLCHCQLSTHVIVSYLLMLLLVIYSCHWQLSTRVIVGYLLMSLLVIYTCHCQLSIHVIVSYLLMLLLVI